MRQPCEYIPFSLQYIECRYMILHSYENIQTANERTNLGNDQCDCH